MKMMVLPAAALLASCASVATAPQAADTEPYANMLPLRLYAVTTSGDGRTVCLYRQGDVLMAESPPCSQVRYLSEMPTYDKE